MWRKHVGHVWLKTVLWLSSTVTTIYSAPIRCPNGRNHDTQWQAFGWFYYQTGESQVILQVVIAAHVEVCCQSLFNHWWDTRGDTIQSDDSTLWHFHWASNPEFHRQTRKTGQTAKSLYQRHSFLNTKWSHFQHVCGSGFRGSESGRCLVKRFVPQTRFIDPGFVVWWAMPFEIDNSPSIDGSLHQTGGLTSQWHHLKWRHGPHSHGKVIYTPRGHL